MRSAGKKTRLVAIASTSEREEKPRLDASVPSSFLTSFMLTLQVAPRTRMLASVRLSGFVLRMLR
jgi:hypothetical protein